MPIPSGYTSAQIVQAVPTGINSAMVFINRTSFSAVATQTFDGVFTSTYGAYLVVIESLFGVTATSYLSWQWRYSSTTQTANCNSAGYGITNNGTANAAYASVASECIVSNHVGTTALPTAASLTVCNVGLSGTPMFTGTCYSSNDTTHRDVGGNCTQQRTYDGFQLKSSSGNITGIVSIYGLTKS